MLPCRVAGTTIQGEGGDVAKVLAADIKAGKVRVDLGFELGLHKTGCLCPHAS
jgi:hypothetical protein